MNTGYQCCTNVAGVLTRDPNPIPHADKSAVTALRCFCTRHANPALIVQSSIIFPCVTTAANPTNCVRCKIKRHFTRAAPGSVLIQAGRTTVLCTASVADKVPPWMAGKGRGWVTAEYGMLPGSTSPRKDRDRGGKIDGRTTEIQRLIGRSLRAVVDLDALGERTITLDCDVLEADGGTRTLSITGALIALVDALHASLAEEAPALPLTSTAWPP